MLTFSKTQKDEKSEKSLVRSTTLQLSLKINTLQKITNDLILLYSNVNNRKANKSSINNDENDNNNEKKWFI